MTADLYLNKSDDLQILKTPKRTSLPKLYRRLEWKQNENKGGVLKIKQNPIKQIIADHWIQGQWCRRMQKNYYQSWNNGHAL